MTKIGEKNFDVRLIERRIHKGDIKQSEYEKHLKALPDDEENGEWVSLEAAEEEVQEN